MVQGSFVAQGASTYLVGMTVLIETNVPFSPRSHGRSVREQREQRKSGANASERYVPAFRLGISRGCLHDVPATRKIQQICHHFRLSDVVAMAASRLYTLALEHKFTRGRRSMHVVAVCIYVACRQKETRNYMLIDFSDLLQVRHTHTVMRYPRLNSSPSG